MGNARLGQIRFQENCFFQFCHWVDTGIHSEWILIKVIEGQLGVSASCSWMPPGRLIDGTPTLLLLPVNRALWITTVLRLLGRGVWTDMSPLWPTGLHREGQLSEQGPGSPPGPQTGLGSGPGPVPGQTMAVVNSQGPRSFDPGAAPPLFPTENRSFSSSSPFSSTSSNLDSLSSQQTEVGGEEHTHNH